MSIFNNHALDLLNNRSESLGTIAAAADGGDGRRKGGRRDDRVQFRKVLLGISEVVAMLDVVNHLLSALSGDHSMVFSNHWHDKL